AAEGHTVLTHAADLADPAAAPAMVAAVEAALGPVDILVNSAGAAVRTAPQELTAAAFHAAMDAKYFTYVHAMQAVLEGMLARGHGVIVNIAGTGGKVPNPIHLPGSAANASLMNLSAGLATTWGSRGIRVNAINPGSTFTGRVQGALEAQSKMTGRPTADLLRDSEARIPLGRYARPEEVADVTLFLASERASYVTGVILTMDGGVHPMVV
ncbi:MAG: SDR family oxidoreductase, partial [Proteobacteria bacterium]|nr:SDR family oxidoreductase [Pseudomonadota bacterium]